MQTVAAVPLADTWGMHGDVGAGWMILMGAMMVLFWGAIVVGIAWLIRGATGGRSGGEQNRFTTENPVQILERRFAEGAITPEDYAVRRKILAGAETHGAPDAKALRADG